MARKSQASIMATPPMGVIAPSHFTPLSTSAYRLPLKISTPASISAALRARQAGCSCEPRAAVRSRPSPCSNWYSTAVCQTAREEASTRERRAWAPNAPRPTPRARSRAPAAIADRGFMSVLARRRRSGAGDGGCYYQTKKQLFLQGACMNATDPVLQDDQSSVVAAFRYRPGRPAEAVDVRSLPARDPAQDGFVWIGLKDPSDELLECVGAQLGLPSKAIEELISPHRRPKLVEYSNCLIVVAITLGMKELRPVFGNTQLVIGPGFLMTVRRGSNSNYLELRSRLENSPELLQRGSDYVASELLDLIVDQYLVSLEQMEKAVETIEQQFLIRGFKESDGRRIYRLRRDLLRIHTAVTPLAELCRRLSRVGLAYVDEDSRAYFGEVADRISRTSEFIGSLREAMAF